MSERLEKAAVSYRAHKEVFDRADRELREAVRAERRAGVGPIEIARRAEISRETVRRYCRALNVPD